MILNPEDKIELMERRLPEVQRLAHECKLCPRECDINRSAGEVGDCRIGYGPVYSSANLHHGEEPPISGTRGSGTIFLTSCNLHCIFCQNYPKSQLRNGIETTPQGLANLNLQDRTAHNINFVTPTHQAAAIFESLIIAYRQGLNLPLVYNSNGYESLEMLKLWDGIMDIYMPDSKYACDEAAKSVSKAVDYVHHNRISLKEMHRQVGLLELNGEGVAQRGLLIRHLVLPGGLTDSEEVLRFIAEELSPKTYISLMSQYFPAYKAHDHDLLKRRINSEEYEQVVDALEKHGLDNGWTQPYR